MSRPTVIQQLPKAYGNLLPCVYKLSCNDHYVIVKAKDHIASVNAIQKAYNQFLRHSPSQRKKDNLYFHFFSYAEKRRSPEFSVEVLFDSENAYELLKYEHEQLNKCRMDSKCLNNNIEPYIPQYNEETMMYGWIGKSSVLNYQKWVKSHK